MKSAAVFLVSLLLLLSWSCTLYASHAAGGELLYERIGTNTYRFVFKFYRACDPGSAVEPPSVKMCYSNQCGVTNQSVTLNKVVGLLPNGKVNGAPVSTGCPGFPTSCNGGSIPGYQEWWYTADLTLSTTCNFWRFWVSISARNNSISNLQTPGNQSIYIEATFDNTISEVNSSPYFSNVPVPYCCVNQLFSYNNGAIDPDGDSLYFETIRPRTGSLNNQNCNMAPLNIAYTSGTYNEVNNPFNTGNTYSLNSATGALSFTAPVQQIAVITIKVSEYRNHQLIGYVMRDLQIIITACNAPSPTLTVDPNSVVGGLLTSSGFQVSSCAGNELKFCFDLKSPSPGSVLVPSDNHVVSIPGGTVTYTNTLTDSVRGCVVWSTTPQDVGLHVLTITVRDSACRPPGLIISNTFSLPVAVNPVTVSSSTVTRTICEGESYLGHTTPGNYIDTLVNFFGCDSIHILDLSVNPSYSHSASLTLCREELPYQFGSQSLVAAGVYTEVFNTVLGCDSTVALTLSVHPSVHPVEKVSICSGESYLGHNTTGVYIDTFTNVHGCDSIRTINLTVLPQTFSVLDEAICPGQQFAGYSAAGTYLDTFVNMYGCDSIRTLHLTVHPVTFSHMFETICEGQSFLGYDTTGVYTDTLVNANGCDSIRTLELTVLPRRYETVDTSICFGENYVGYTTTGTYVDTLISSLGCDSIRTLHLVVKPVKDTLIQAEICLGESFLGYGVAGTYRDTFLSSIGCDSIRILDLTVYPQTYSVLQQGICPGDTFLGYSATGTYLDTFVNMYGCDSIRTLHLTVHPVTYGTKDTFICPGGAYLGHDTAGTYVDTLVNIYGCDSIHTLHLTVRPVLYQTVDTAICSGTSYDGYSIAGTYVDTLTSSLGCDSIRTLHLDVKPLKDTVINMEICGGESFLGYTASGTYVDVFLSSIGCDSFRHLNLTVHPVYLVDTLINTCEGSGYFRDGVLVTPGVYYDSLLTVMGCDSVIRTTITFSPDLYPDLGPDRNICPGDSLELFPGSYRSYDWSTGDADARIWVKEPGAYAVAVENVPGCSAADTVVIGHWENPELHVPHDDQICLGDTIRLEVSGAKYYEWYLGQELRQTGTEAVYAFETPDLEQIVVTVAGTDEHGCKDILALQFRVISCCGKVYLPNTFTPNGDGRNDRFRVVTAAIFEQFQMIIMDRWGRAVFETNDQYEAWDGNYRGAPLQMDTYFYMIKMKCYRNDKPVVTKGDVILVR